jgi:hypothetical protein
MAAKAHPMLKTHKAVLAASKKLSTASAKLDTSMAKAKPNYATISTQAGNAAMAAAHLSNMLTAHATATSYD